MSELRRFPDPAATARAAAEFILDDLDAARRERGRAALAVSGGSTPEKMFAAMAAAGFSWDGIDLFWVDERLVPPGHPDSNYSMTEAALIKPAGIPSAQVHRVRGELEPAAATARYVAEIQAAFGLADGEAPVFDVVHLGMGGDGHTASLFPGSPLIEREGVADWTRVEARESTRVTLLKTVLLRARRAVFLAVGGDKAEALKAVREGPEDFRLRPAQIVERLHPNVVWFVDADAG